MSTIIKDIKLNIFEIMIAIIILLIDALIWYLPFNLYNTNPAFFQLEILISRALLLLIIITLLLYLFNLPLQLSLAGALWGCVVFHTLPLHSMPYYGPIFIALESLFCGVVVGIRTGVQTFKAVCISLIAAVTTFYYLLPLEW